MSTTNVRAEVRVGPLGRMSPKRFGRLRDLSGLTLDELGKRTGIDIGVLCRFERGYTKLTPALLNRAVRILRKEIQRRAEAWESILAEESGGQLSI